MEDQSFLAGFVKGVGAHCCHLPYSLTSLRGANGSRECAPDDRLRDEAIQTPSFRGDAKHRTMMCNCTSENLEIPRCAIAHLGSGANAPSRNDVVCSFRSSRLRSP